MYGTTALIDKTRADMQRHHEATKPPLAKDCPFCGKPANATLSGRGKHYGYHCAEHGFVAIIRNPLFPPAPKRSFLQRLFGR